MQVHKPTTMNYSSLIEQVSNYITGTFTDHAGQALYYHNLKHTEQVVNNAGRIATHYKLNDRDYFTVIAAAWFHDIGYNLGQTAGHEATGAALADDFLRPRGVDEPTLLAIRNCILSTQMPQRPVNLCEQIVCDADLYHLGTDSFPGMNKLMRKEMEERLGRKISKGEWRKGAIRLLEQHHYHTDYARHLLDAGKAENLQQLNEKEREEDPAAPSRALTPPSSTLYNEGQPNNIETKKPKSDRPDKGIETMFRVSSSNHQRLSDMADNKAHIMVTTTSIIISVLLSVLLRKLEDNPYLTIPTMMLLTVCLVTMVFSILATRPSLPHGTFTQADVDNQKVNLLFFGNFYRMPYRDYYAGMEKVMDDRSFLYGSLIMDLYSQGVVLGRKFRLLRIAYNVFMFGIVISVVAFAVSAVFFAH